MNVLQPVVNPEPAAVKHVSRVCRPSQVSRVYSDAGNHAEDEPHPV